MGNEAQQVTINIHTPSNAHIRTHTHAYTHKYIFTHIVYSIGGVNSILRIFISLLVSFKLFISSSGYVPSI